MKEVIEIKEIKQYVGNCPICGVEQKNPWAHNVDVKCSGCENKEKAASKTDAITYLESLGLKIEYYVDYGDLYIRSIGFDHKEHSYEIESTCDESESAMELWEYKLKSD